MLVVVKGFRAVGALGVFFVVVVRAVGALDGLSVAFKAAVIGALDGLFVAFGAVGALDGLSVDFKVVGALDGLFVTL